MDLCFGKEKENHPEEVVDFDRGGQLWLVSREDAYTPGRTYQLARKPEGIGQGENMRKWLNSMKAIHKVLQARYMEAGSPVHSTEPCLWDMERFIRRLKQQRKPDDVLAEAVMLLEAWIADGKPATDMEKAALQMAKEDLAVPA